MVTSEVQPFSLIKMRLLTQYILNTNLRTCAIKIYAGTTCSVCSLFLPRGGITRQDITILIQQLHPPFLLLGDINAHSPIGVVQSLIINELPISIMNNNSPTHIHFPTGAFSVIDLSICSSYCILNFDYSIDDSLHDSDHFLIHLTTRGARFGESMVRFNTE